MSYLVKDQTVLKKYNEMWQKVGNSIKGKFNSEPVHNKKYLKIKLKFYKGKINTKKDLNVFIHQ